MVEHGRLGGARGLAVVVGTDGVEQLRQDVGGEPAAVTLDHAETEVHVPQQASLVRRSKGRAATQLVNAPDVVEQGGSDQQVAAQARMELRRLAAERGHADRVLQQAAGVSVMAVRPCGRKVAHPVPHHGVGEDGLHEAGQALMGDLAREELEESLQLVGVAPQAGRKVGGVRPGGRLERSYLHLESPSEPLDAPQHVYRIPLLEAAIEQLDVVPDPRLDASRRVHELEREVGGATLGAQPALAGDGVHALHGAILDQLGDCGHGGESMPGTLDPMADVAPFRAVRYARPSESVVAPPYDVISPDERARLLAKDPHNIVHLTLAESEEAAGEHYREWLRDGVLVLDAAAAAWVVVQDYVGPDGVARSRTGLVASLRVEPYETGTVLPHERTHAGPKESRLRLLRATQAQLEPIFLLYDGAPPVGIPEREPDLEAEGTRLWRLAEAEVGGFFADRQLLIADGHHRYETAVAYAAESGRDRMLVVLVSTEDPGLEVFPTHRVFQGRPEIAPPGIEVASLDSGLRLLASQGYERPAALLVTRRGIQLLRGQAGELDVELVDAFGHEGISYTPDTDEAVSRVIAGDADCAFLLRATRIEDVFTRARSGQVMPQKTTYFFPKLLSGLLIHPV